MELIAQGRDCDVFDLGDGTVLRRQRGGRSLEGEAAIMRHVAHHGFPCPAVHHVEGPDMVLDRVEGVTLAHELLSDPSVEGARAAGRLLADLHARLHQVPPPGSRVGAVLHLDLHPENVLVTSSGPVVIDWTNATHGPAEVDVAMTWLILEPFAQALPLARELLEVFLDTAGRGAARTGLRVAGGRRLGDPNLTDQERAVVEALLQAEDAT